MSKEKSRRGRHSENQNSPIGQRWAATRVEPPVRLGFTDGAVVLLLRSWSKFGRKGQTQRKCATVAYENSVASFATPCHTRSAPPLQYILLLLRLSILSAGKSWVGMRVAEIRLQNVRADIPDQEMSDAEAADDETHSAHAQPPPATPPLDAGKRFQVTTSNISGKLSRLPDEATEVYREVAERILSDGYLSLTEAAEMLGKKHTGRALEKLLGNLPLVAFASSRKEGWLLIPKDEEQYASIHTLIRRAAEQAEIIANFGNLSPGEFSDLVHLSWRNC